MRKSVLIVLALGMTILCNAALAADKSSKSIKSNANSQAGGLPALAAEVAQLRGLLAALQDQVNGSDDPYTGTYVVSLVEQQLFACSTFPGPVAPGTPPFGPYIFQQGNSLTSSRIAYFEAYADGQQLVIPDYLLSIQDLRLSGNYVAELRQEEGFVLEIAADGSLLANFGDGEVVRGQMSADGSTFIGQGLGLFNQGSCADAYMTNVVGIRK